MKWSVGITTVPERYATLLPETIASICLAGFSVDRVFSDGGLAGVVKRSVESSKIKVSVRNPRIGTVGNWILGLWELYVRNPMSDRYVMFQDDVVCVNGLRGYLEECGYTESSYANLYTDPENENHLKGIEGWHRSNQLGKGALALMFDNNSVRKLLSAPHLTKKQRSPSARRVQNLDGCVVQAMRESGYEEYVHMPSLVQHVGEESTMNHKLRQQSKSFPGEEFDARNLL